MRRRNPPGGKFLESYGSDAISRQKAPGGAGGEFSDRENGPGEILRRSDGALKFSASDICRELHHLCIVLDEINISHGYYPDEESPGRDGRVGMPKTEGAGGSRRIFTPRHC